jgi:hypothetical protein
MAGGGRVMRAPNGNKSVAGVLRARLRAHRDGGGSVEQVANDLRIAKPPLYRFLASPGDGGLSLPYACKLARYFGLSLRPD